MNDDNESLIDILTIDPYNICIGYDILHLLPNYILKLKSSYDKYILITDENLFQIYGENLLKNFQLNQINLLYYIIPPGEQSKSRQMKYSIEDYMFENNCGIDTLILSFGGGVVGDLSGFIASTYMRGIDYIQIPTSFLSMIDSSIGGKTSINIEKYGKNLLGTFYHPQAIFIDIQFLETLSLRDLSNGLAECIKISLISDREFFIFIENNIENILNKNKKILFDIIHQSIKLKLNIIKHDEKEIIGLRSILNFGHSIGHAIEILLNGLFLHGECISIGMIYEIQLSKTKHLLDNSDMIFNRIIHLLKSFNLPIKYPRDLSINDIINKMSIDKKNRYGKKQIVMLKDIGSIHTYPSYTTTINDQELIDLFENFSIDYFENIQGRKKFIYLFGQSIQHSLSPLMHQTAFDYLNLPYTYKLYQTNQILSIKNLMENESFYGASVTMPFKEEIYLKLFQNYSVSQSVLQIGAMNTIIKYENTKKFYGENTDWLAMYKLINEQISLYGSAIIIGAGGTAKSALYALQKIKFIQSIYIYNPRTPEKANDLVEKFHNKENISSITQENLNRLENISIIINTLPSSSNFILDNLVFQQQQQQLSSILFDVNYIPYQTLLIKQALDYNWKIIYGIDMFIEQGLQQLQIWTEKADIVASIVKKNVMKKYQQIINSTQPFTSN